MYVIEFNVRRFSGKRRFWTKQTGCVHLLNCSAVLKYKVGLVQWMVDRTKHKFLPLAFWIAMINLFPLVIVLRAFVLLIEDACSAKLLRKWERNLREWDGNKAVQQAYGVLFHIHNREPSSRGYNPPVMALLWGFVNNLNISPLLFQCAFKRAAVFCGSGTNARLYSIKEYRH
jgi:hypothetical protein